MESKEIEVRKKILNIFNENPKMSQSKIAKTLGIAKSTVQNVLFNFRKTLTVERKSGSGRKAGPVDKKLAKKIVDTFKRNPSLSNSDVADKCSVSKSYVQKIKKNAGLKSYKVTTTPNRDEKQEISAKSRCRKLYDQLLTKYDCIVMDDETYVKADFKQLPGEEFYVAKSCNGVADKYKTRKLSKFPKKYMIWQAICTCGLKSQFYVATGTVNQEIYTKECLQKRLLPFIQKHDCSVLFWPDLASCHYGRMAKNWYEANGVHVVPREANPPNCPELRPIEKYWAIVKRKLLKTKCSTVDESQFKKKWKKASDQVTEEDVQRLMAGVKAKVRRVIHSHEIK